VQNVVVKTVVTPVLIGGASLAGRRWGHQVGGWLAGLSLTSGPLAACSAGCAGFAKLRHVGPVADAWAVIREANQARRLTD
jgi:hypothetical protein